jgi:threonine/homoserine/homoserine lactone efflux protein
MAEPAAMLSGIWRPLLTLVVAAIVVMGSPGPSTISATAVGAAFGFRRSMQYIWGLILGTMAVLIAVALGLVAMLRAIPQAAPVLAIISVVYILYLAFRIATAPPLPAQSQAVSAPVFAGGFLLAIANPKAYLAIAAVFAGTTVWSGDAFLDAVIKTALLGMMIVIIHVVWLLAGAFLSRLLQSPVSSRILNVILAVSLVASTFATFLS